MSDHKALEVVFHELCHMISDTLELDLTEQQVKGLGVGLAEAFRPFLKLKKLGIKR